MKKLLLTLLIIPSLSFGEERSVPDYECIRISSLASKIYNECQDKYFGQEYNNLSDRFSKIIDCEISRYNKEVCQSKDYWKMLKEDEQKFLKAKAIREKLILTAKDTDFLCNSKVNQLYPNKITVLL